MQLRPFSFRSNLSACVQLINIVARQAGTGMTTSETEQRALARLPGRNLETDRFLAFEKDILVGYGDVWHSPANTAADSHIAVHPDYRRQGVASKLLEQLQTRAQTLGATTLNAYADPLHPEASPFLEAQHFGLAGYFRRLEHSAPNTVAAFPLPAGFSLLPYTRVNQPDLLQRAYASCYQDMFGHKVPLAATIQHLLSLYAHAHIFLLFKEAEVVGVCRVDIDEDGAGHIDAAGLAKPYRQLELLQSLTAHALEVLRNAGCQHIDMVSWGDQQATIKAYRTMGFRVTKEVPGYAKPLR